MAVPVYESFAEKKEINNNSVEISKPTGVVEGDILIVHVSGGSTFTSSVSRPPGFVQISSRSASDYSYDVSYKVATDSEPSSYTFTWIDNTDVYAYIIRVSGCDVDDVLNGVNESASGPDASPVCPTFTTDINDCLILRMMTATDRSINVDSGYPAGTTGITLDSSSNSGKDCSAGAAYESQVSAGATGTAEYSLTDSKVWTAFTLAFNPASSPPEPDPMTFSSAPAYVDDTSITMTASLASHDTEGVEYYFTNTAGGGNDSSWQASRTYVDSGLLPDTQYTYTVTARSDTSLDETAASAASAAYTFPATPIAPSGLAVASTSNSILDLTWSDDNDSYQETGMQIERSLDGATGWTLVETGPADDEAYQDTSLDSNTQYFYRVRAFITGNAGTSYSSYTSVANNYTRPDNPTSLGLTAISYQQIDLDWTGEGSYKVERSETGNFSGEEVEVVSESDALSDSAYSDTDVVEDTTYYYRVRAYNDGGESAGYTSEVSILTPPEPPADPSALTASSISNSRIDLAWTDNSSSPNEDGFEIWRSTTSAVAGFTLLTTNAADDTTYSDTSLDSNTQYWYKVRGFIESPLDSDTVSYSGYTAVANNFTRPDNISALSIVPSYDDIDANLSWTGEGKFRVEKSLTGVGDWLDITPELTGYWPMDDDEENKLVVDKSGKDHDGEASANTDTLSEPGHSGLSLNMGGDHVVTVAHHSDFNFFDGDGDLPFSVSVWAYVVPSLLTKYLVTKLKNNGDGEWVVKLTPQEYIEFYLTDELNGKQIGTIVDDVVADGWHHIVCTYDGSKTAAGLLIYIDNVLVNQTIDDSEEVDYVRMGTIDADRDVRIGDNDLGTANQKWLDKIDEVSIYDVELSVNQVDQLYNAGVWFLKTAPFLVDNNLDAETTYYYRVMAYNDGGDASGYSSIVSILTLLDLSVEPFTATKDGTTGWSTINLAWTNPEVSSSDEYYFIIERMEDGFGDPDDANNAGWNVIVGESDLYESAAYADADVNSNTKYHYQVKVYSPNDSNYSIRGLDDATTDPAPEIPVADAGEDQTIDYADRASVNLDGSGSTSEAEITSYVWRNKGLTLATGVTATIELAEGEHRITLGATSEIGTDYDDVTVTIGLQPIDIASLIPEKFR